MPLVPSIVTNTLLLTMPSSPLTWVKISWQPGIYVLTLPSVLMPNAGDSQRTYERDSSQANADCSRLSLFDILLGSPPSLPLSQSPDGLPISCLAWQP